MTKWYRDTQKDVGWVCPMAVPDLQTMWRLFTGGLSAKFMGEMGDGIDFVFLDTTHMLPGEVLDFLMILPYLKKDALVILHDVALFEDSILIRRDQSGLQNLPGRLLLSVLPGEKLTPSSSEHKYLPNIGAVRLDGHADKVVDDLLGLLTLPWAYIPTQEDIDVATESLADHYGGAFGQLLAKTVALQRDMYEVRCSLPCYARLIAASGYHCLLASGLPPIKWAATRLKPVVVRAFKH